MSRSASELDSASKRYFQVANLPDVVKPWSRQGSSRHVHLTGLAGWLETARAEGMVWNLGELSVRVEPNDPAKPYAWEGTAEVGGAHSTDEAG